MKQKFKAWKKTNGPEMFEDIRAIDFEKNIIRIGYKLSEYTTRIDEESLDNVELLQSTGLFDKNGKEIFIGDLILTENGVEEVTFTTQNDCYGVYLTDKNAFGTPIDYYATKISSEHIKGEIIGNRFEHPHLLEEE